MQRRKQHNVREEGNMKKKLVGGIFWNFKKLLGAQEKCWMHQAIPSKLSKIEHLMGRKTLVFPLIFFFIPHNTISL